MVLFTIIKTEKEPGGKKPLSELMYGNELACHRGSGCVDPQLYMLGITAASWIHSQARNKQPAASTPYAFCLICHFTGLSFVAQI